MVVHEAGDAWREADVEVVLQLINATEVGSRARAAVALRIAVSHTSLAEEAEPFAVAQVEIHPGEERTGIGVGDRLEVIDREAEVVAQLQGEIPQVGDASPIRKAGTNGDIILDKVADQGGHLERIAIAGDVFQDRHKLEVVIHMLVVGEGSSHHPLPLGDKGLHLDPPVIDRSLSP